MVKSAKIKRNKIKMLVNSKEKPAAEVEHVDPCMEVNCCVPTGSSDEFFFHISNIYY